MERVLESRADGYPLRDQLQLSEVPRFRQKQSPEDARLPRARPLSSLTLLFSMLRVKRERLAKD